MENELSNAEKLMNSLLPFAQQQLEKQGEFFPFAGMLTKDGEAHLGMADASKLNEKGGTAISQEMIDRIVAAHKKENEKGNLLVSAICFDTRVAKDGEEKEDAICIAIEEEDGKSINVFLPYKKNFFGKIKYGELFASPKEITIFKK